MTLPVLHSNWQKYTGLGAPETRHTIASAEFLFDPHIARNVTPWQFPDNPFDYVGFLESDGINQSYRNLAKDCANKKIAIVGAGAAGLCAAYELLKANPKIDITVFEATKRAGGRLHSKSFPPYEDMENENEEKISGIEEQEKRGPLIEIGAMRFPPSHKLFTYYRDLFKLEHAPFPNPHVVHTVLNYSGETFSWLKEENQPPGPFRTVREKLGMVVGPIVQEIHENWDDPEARTRVWQKTVDKYKNKSFYNALADTGLFTESEMAIFGALGVGTGGFRGLYRVNFLEILRLEIGGWDKDQVLIKNGSESLIDSFLKGCSSFAIEDNFKLVLEVPITALRKTGTKGRTELFSGAQKLDTFDAVILTPTTHAIQMNMDIDDGIFTPAVNRAIRNVHLMNATKLAVHPHPGFWQKARELGMAAVTLTDLAMGQAYCLDYGEKADVAPQNYEVKWSQEILLAKINSLPKEEKNKCSIGSEKYLLLQKEAEQEALKRTIQARDLPTTDGVIFLSYAWGEDSTKFASRTKNQAVNLCVDNLKKIYKGYLGLPEWFDEYLRPLETHKTSETSLPDDQIEWVNWQDKEYTVGAFKLNYSGQQEDVLQLYYQYAGFDPVSHRKYKPSGVFLAGDGISWAGGWVEGALHTAINAALAVCNFLTPEPESDNDEEKKEENGNENKNEEIEKSDHGIQNID